MRVPFQLAGQIGENRSTQFSSEVMRNVYMTYSESNKRIAVTDFPGLKLISSGSGADRGSHVMSDERYLINGSSLIKETSLGVRATLGTITGSDRAIFADDGTNLYIVVDKKLYKYDGISLSVVSQSAIATPRSIDYLNRQFILTGDNGIFAVSDVSDGDTYNALNVAEEESRPDALLRVYVFNELAYMMGSQTVVPWENTGTGNPPFQKRKTSLINVGLAGKYAVTNNDQYMYWLGDDRKFYQSVGGSLRPINTSGVSTKVEGFDVVSDCIASAFVLGGQDFVMFKFPSANTCLLYSEQNKYWVELNSGTLVTGSEWYGNSVSYCYGKNLVTDYRNGNTYELDLDTYTDNGDARLRIVTTRTFTGDDIGLSGQHITASQLRLEMQSGIGLATGQGSSPVVMCQFSQDGGMTWGAEQQVDVGIMGDYVKAVDFWAFSSGYEIKARLLVSDPVPITYYGGIVNLEDAGY